MNNERYLVHHGILGQKWGVRRYRNEDGTLTEAGKARYSTDGKRLDPRNMSTKQLQEANERLNLENNYRQMTGRKVTASSTFTRDNAIKIGASAVAAGGATLLVNALGDGTAASGRKLVNKVLLASGSAAITAAAVAVNANGGGKKK